MTHQNDTPEACAGNRRTVSIICREFIASFRGQERRSVAEKNPKRISAQSDAGVAALKNAIVELLRRVKPDRHAGVNDFSIGHDKNGAPVLTGLTVPGIGIADIKISIAHTRDFAYGCAAMNAEVD